MVFSEEYFRLFEDAPSFRETVARKYSLDGGVGRISERLLRCIWFDRLYQADGLSTRDGKRLVVHSPGTWNLEGGPDFRRAEITIGTVRLKGDVELHIDPAGWRSHAHSSDSEYDNVILHVTLSPHRKEPRPGDRPMTRHGVEISEIALWDRLADDLRLLKCALRPDEYPYSSVENHGRCRDLIERSLSDSAKIKLLCIAGDARMIARYRRFAYEAEKNELDQVAYGAMLEGMGYKAHTKQFGLLSQKLPYAALRERVLSAGEMRNSEDRIRLTQALLLGAAGLLPTAQPDDPPDVKEYLLDIGRLWRERGFDKPADGAIEWKRAAVRPANLPERRMAGAGHVLSRSYSDGFFLSVIERITMDSAKKAQKECVEFLTPAEDGFWSYRYSPHGKTLSRPVGLIGRDRALTIIVNSFTPLGLLDARTRKSREGEELVHEFYCGLPSLPPNNTTRLMEYRMFGVSPKERVARTARTQQGLLQIFADWCSEDPSCQNCGIASGLESGSIRDRLG